MNLKEANEKVLIVDFGSQVTQLIARRIREQSVYCEIISFQNFNKLKFIENIKGVVLSGGPSSISEIKSPKIKNYQLLEGIPILAICYGHQLITKKFGGKVKFTNKKEFGRAEIYLKDNSLLTNGFFKNKKNSVWMSHSDQVVKMGKNFSVVASTKNAKYAITQNITKKIFTVQFHPEVVHTNNGNLIFKNFLFNICKCKKKWTNKSKLKKIIFEVKQTVGSKKVLCALSGGVDSSVLAHILQKAIKQNLYCVYIDTGLMRKNESIEIVSIYKKKFKKNFIYLNEGSLFLKNLKNVFDPEKKRKIIGKTFINVFEKFSKKNKGINFLAQGTLYPDIVESQSFSGSPTSKIKSHHNVGGLPKKMNFKLIEPFREMFKDEVRILGKKMNISSSILDRHPFPGPGLAIRILGPVDNKKIKILQNADDIFIKELKKRDLYKNIWQAFAALLPIKSVGVMGDNRTYDYVCVLRAVTSIDGMTADFYNFKNYDISEISSKIVNEVNGINRVVYDVTSKPPGTIEWE
jgi:GMP synthase (glutamine-hydrolysing)